MIWLILKNFHSNLLKTDKKSHQGINIYYIGYFTIKKFSDSENSHIMNPLCLIIHSAAGDFKEKTSEKYLILDSTGTYDGGFSGIKSEIKTLNCGKKLFYGKKLWRIGINTDDDLPLDK